MDKDEYINSLENLLIFMCQTHENQQKTLLALAKNGNNAYFEIPQIQGTGNLIPIAQIATIDFNHPTYGFNEVKNEILRKRSNS